MNESRETNWHEGIQIKDLNKWIEIEEWNWNKWNEGGEKIELKWKNDINELIWMSWKWRTWNEWLEYMTWHEGMELHELTRKNWYQGIDWRNGNA